MLDNSRPFNPWSKWAPRFWHSMSFRVWMKFWAAGRFRVPAGREYTGITTTLYTPLNSILARWQLLRYGKQIAKTEITHPPVFIIGHWRSGTTFLHELMYLDPQFVTPTTYQCFAPAHFLVSEVRLKKILAGLLPTHRPMDNMELGFDHPQEDEFALLALGAPTPYRRIAFPNDAPVYEEFLDMQGVAPQDMKRFEDALLGFAKALTFHSQGKRILFKSPPHTGRVETLSRMFPGAKFIHLTRNPYSLFASTERLWDALDFVHGLVLPKDNNGSRREYVFHCLEKMYAGFESQRGGIDARHICDLKYEDLTADPLKELNAVYQKLDLGDFNLNLDKVSAFLTKRKDYQTNQYRLADDDLKAAICQRWARYFERYGYT